ncbi:hypothetical protein TRFO_21500 [Tritrichomonas foetus]|uniref:Peptidase S8/S53 domain-containing protein n=1 Tax=Tritrichomonas foetus TaxID=1144522 RepID=A0A1J4KIU3_9EUKA|nr:hypothetical protein TRFO_21500 [Tritrichomonas foetus]|eukprot:OHT09606.1 hypothetical protein TRFO_21500 [Tritrichomonas foetus]
MFIISLLVYVDINRMLNSNSNNFGFATMRGNKIISMENEKMLRHGSKRMMSSEQDKEWYYVKFNKCISMKEKREISSTINVKLDSFDMVTKSLYQLYLNQKQIYLLIEKNASIHRFEPEDKISISDVSQRKEYHKYLIIVHDTYTLPIQENLYQIIAKSSSTSYVVSVSVKKMKEAVKYLSKLSGVSLITDYVEATLNNHYASGFVQKNEQKFAENSEYMPRYLNDKGITGKNEIVTIIDDLIDFHHSHFYDEKVNVTFKTHLPSHRKIVYYNYSGTIAEFQQQLELDSHGTHVAGTMAGNNVCTDQKLKHYDGNAPDAKIAYASNVSNPEKLNVVIKTMKITNSKISTNSWSTRENVPYQTFVVNQLSVENPDKLFIFSSGNMG